MTSLDQLFATHNSLPALQANAEKVRYDLRLYLDFAKERGFLSTDIHSGIIDIARTILERVGWGEFTDQRDYDVTLAAPFWQVVSDLADPKTCYIRQDLLPPAQGTTSEAAQLLLEHKTDLTWLWKARDGENFFTVFNRYADGGRLCDTQMVSNNYTNFTHWFVDPRIRK